MLNFIRKLCIFIRSLYIYRYIVCELKYMLMGVTAIAEDIDKKKTNRCGNVFF